jgi:biopolymer transport protein TolR
MLRKPRKLKNEINVVPYIDVMLVLLVIFMVTAPLVNPGQIELPGMGSSVSPVTAPIEITVRADKTIWFRDRSTADKEIEVVRFEIGRMVKKRQEKNANQSVVIAADKTLPYEDVMKVMDALREANVKRIGLLAKPRKG